MRDIREVSYDEQDVVRQMLDEFFQKVDEKYNLEPEIIEKFMDFWSKGNIKILGKYVNDSLLGVAFLGQVTNVLSIIHVHQVLKVLDREKVSTLERELFDTGFEYLRLRKPWVATYPPAMNANLAEYALNIGFKRYEKIEMIADRETLETAPVPKIPSGYTLVLYNDQLKDELASLFYESFKDSDSANAEPQGFHTQELCLAAINHMVNGGDGDFKNGSYSWILKHGNEIVGVNLRTLLDETTGLGAAMCLKPSYRGKGLGKLLFVHSLRYLLEQEPKVKKMELYVYETNPARHLYASVGFKETSRFSIYTWLQDDES